MTRPSSSTPLRRAERRVIVAAMKLADAGKGFVFKDDLKVSDTGHAMALERACAKLNEVMKK